MPRDLPVGNGTVLINFDSDYNFRDIYFPHVGQENQTKGHRCRFGVWADGEFAWVGQDWDMERIYLPETLVTDVRLRNDSLALELRVHDAVDFHLWIYLRQIAVRDLSGRERSVRLYFNHDFHVLENDVGDTAFYDPRTQSVIHYKKDRWFLINMCDPSKCGVDQWATGNKEVEGFEGTWRDAEDGNLSGNPIAQGSVDSTIGIGLTVPAAGEARAHYWICFGVAYEKVVKLNSIVRERTPESLIERTESYWRLWVNSPGLDFQDLSPDIVALFKRSLLIIRTQIDEGGAILAANDYDVAMHSRDTYSYMWPRDGALTAFAMGRAGFRDIAQKFFRFCLDAITEDGYLLHKYNPDGTLASSWHPWLRDGELDLPIQEDETALTLWSLWEHFRQFKDVEFVKPLYRRLVTNAADFMVRFRDRETGLPLPSYDLWEERWGVHLFTTAAVVGGLTAAANFAEAFGEGGRSGIYRQAAQEVRQAMLAHMWSEKDGRFSRTAIRTAGGYTLDTTVDASLFGVFAFGALPADHPAVVASMEAVYRKLWVKTAVGGVARYENDRYHQVSQDLENVPGNPWFVCTLWLAQHRIAVAKRLQDLESALSLLEWVASRALPSGVLAEQVHPYSDEPLSVSPLTWSHATFVACVLDYLERKQILGGA